MDCEARLKLNRKWAMVALVFLLVGLCNSGSVRADVLIDNFTTEFNGSSYVSVPSAGSIKLTLNGNGTIAVQLTSTSAITEAGFDSPFNTTYVAPIGYTLTQDWNPGPGEYHFAMLNFDNTSETLNWTIGQFGEFTSVQQAVGAGHASYDFALENASGLFVSGVESAVPEPGIWAMIILGFCSIGFMAYRRRSMPIFRPV